MGHDFLGNGDGLVKNAEFCKRDRSLTGLLLLATSFPDLLSGAVVDLFEGSVGMDQKDN